MTSEQFVKAIEIEQKFIMRNSNLKSDKAYEIAVQNILQELGHKQSTYTTIANQFKDVE